LKTECSGKYLDLKLSIEQFRLYNPNEAFMIYTGHQDSEIKKAVAGWCMARYGDKECMQNFDLGTSWETSTWKTEKDVGN
jgi:hypothetical protein